ncbi:ABC transporter ATP-binding protein [Amycolatopsis cynarae]|uniref:ABC transporter ATP-binding protein n=1 Tax=Amycolatopsis cynarae TaxID=2995223 RepID=A0ABY7AZ22_9PSEU|nr:ABC transporter ATP-binding protein [Amycolatopsis sp. HUAS 11-8]WAL63848.1 ABC transporter ATP-binding protein [Amycolatopsis sp. HUAS 11-8]
MSADRPAISTSGRGPVRSLWGYTRGIRVVLVGLLALDLAANAAALIQPLAARWVLDQLEAHRSVLGPALMLAGVAAVGLVLVGLSTFLLERTGQHVVRGVRRGLVGRVLHAEVGVVERGAVGDFLSRLGSDTTLLEEDIAGSLVHAAASPLTVVAALVLMATVDQPMFLLVVGMLTVTTVAERWSFRWLSRATEDAQARVAGMLSGLQRALIAFRTVKASGTEDLEDRLIGQEADSAYRAGVRAARARAILEVVAMIAVDVTFLVVLAVGAARVASGDLGLPDLVAFLLYVIFLRDPIETTTVAAAALSAGLAAVKRIEEVRTLPPEPVTTHAGPPRASAGGGPADVRFEGVWFGYRGVPVLRDVTVGMGVGLTVLAGPSGSGKTTILSLIERFADVERGRITLEGRDLRDLDRAELRHRLAYVQQEAPLLGDTIRAAALYGVPDPEHADLGGALRAVALDDWVARLPDGLDTVVGERGVAISGGQRQRLAVARALLRGADVLLLDEATSQLDAVSERTLLDSVAHQARTRTVIAATHRLSVAATADQVVLLANGRVRSIGLHDELIRGDRLYRELASVGGGTGQEAGRDIP